MSQNSNILYVSYTGMLEPLGRSQVLSYLSRLSNDFRFTLVSFEKRQDLSDLQAVEELRHECSRYGIIWQPRVYHHRPRLLATVWDLLILLWMTLRISIQRDVTLVHCRGYIPAIAAWLCGKITRKPFVFDMRALWPDEMVTAGRLNKYSFVYKSLKWVERRLLRDAGKIVSLTEAAVHHLIAIYPDIPCDSFEVIPTCVDLSRFKVPEKFCSNHPLDDRNPFVVGVMGSLLSGWFYLDDLFAFFRELKALRADTVMSIVTRDNHSEVLARAMASGLDLEDIRIAVATPAEMPDYISQMDLGVMLYAPDIGRAPTRFAEFLATGVPVVGNSGVGDMGGLIGRHGVGIVIDNVHDEKSLANSARKLFEAYDHIVASHRCRTVAEEFFTADKGAEHYRKIYRQVTNYLLPPS